MKKRRKLRNPYAVVAKFRNSAGAMKDKDSPKKDRKKTKIKLREYYR